LTREASSSRRVREIRTPTRTNGSGNERTVRESRTASLWRDACGCRLDMGRILVKGSPSALKTMWGEGELPVARLWHEKREGRSHKKKQGNGLVVEGCLRTKIPPGAISILGPHHLTRGRPPGLPKDAMDIFGAGRLGPPGDRARLIPRPPLRRPGP